MVTIKEGKIAIIGSELTHDMFEVKLVSTDGTERIITEYTITPDKVPDTIGEFEITIKAEGKEKKIMMNADKVYKNWEIGDPIKTDVIATLYESGSLVFTGIGDTISYNASGRYGSFPWYKDREKIKHIVFEDSVEPDSLQEYFYDCNNLISVNKIPNSVNSLYSTFYNCPNLENVPNIPENATMLYETFYGCTKLKGEIKIEIKAVDSYLYRTFYNAATSNEKLVFSGDSIYLLDLFNTKTEDSNIWVKSDTRPSRPIGKWAFGTNKEINGTNAIVTLYEDNTLIFSGTGDTISYDASGRYGSLPWYKQREKIKYIIFEDSIEPHSLQEYFYDCNNLISVNKIPNSVNSLYRTFYNCANLENVPNIPENATMLYETFYGCTKLKGEMKIEVKTVDSYLYRTFYNAATSSEILYLTGSSPYLLKIMNTKSDNSNIQIKN